MTAGPILPRRGMNCTPEALKMQVHALALFGIFPKQVRVLQFSVVDLYTYSFAMVGQKNIDKPTAEAIFTDGLLPGPFCKKYHK